MKVSVILPTHNEKENITVLLRMIETVMKDVPTEVIVVDDGSTDGTSEACRELSSTLSTIQVSTITRAQKTGLGSAYVCGVGHATGEYVLIMDADLSHDPRDMLRLLRRAEETGAGVVIGTRYTKEGGFSNWPFFRKLTSRTANLLAGMFTGKTHSDMTNSYRVYRRDVLQAGIRKVQATGFAYQMEILYHCKTRVEEVPVCFYERSYGRSKLGPYEYFHFLFWGSVLLCRRLQLLLHRVLYCECSEDFFE
ncbi:dolichol-phosphate mannosyltransferase [Nematocida displodere]|uniref:Dolichol-phosphate mannosyltransferase subunit 1 n=1 Tax=Nematocida displodere TaxID=1805483 RepID=A0A177EI61_9MICR|nr:dolichol-phosphate mannosyltransferase [Nematocida displodere]